MSLDFRITLDLKFSCHLLFQAMTQERRRYGFVLERHCSLAKHYLAYHSSGQSMYQRGLDDWQDIAKTREFLPESVDSMFASKLRVNISYNSFNFYSLEISDF